MTDQRIEWGESPPPSQTTLKHDLVRCPKTATGPWLITSDRHIGCQLFWMGGRSQPHLGGEHIGPDGRPVKNCNGCRDDRPHRWNGWLCVYHEATLKHAILEITVNCLEPIEEHLRQLGTLRGSRIKLSRQGGRPNGRVTATLTRTELTLTQIPEAFDLRTGLEKLWQAPSKKAAPLLETPRVAETPKIDHELRTMRFGDESEKPTPAKTKPKPPAPKTPPLTAAEKKAASEELALIDRLGVEHINGLGLSALIEAGFSARSAGALIKRREERGPVRSK